MDGLEHRMQRQESRELKPGSEYAVLRRSIAYALRDLGRTSNVLARQIGGVRTLRDAPGSGLAARLLVRPCRTGCAPVSSEAWFT